MQCHAVGCARNRNASFVVLRLRHDCMVKAQVEEFKCVQRRRGRPGDAKATGGSKDQLGIIHVHKWLLSRFTELFCLKKDDDIQLLRYCRLRSFVYG